MTAQITTLRRPGREPPAPTPIADPLAYVALPAAAQKAHDALLSELSRIRPTLAGNYTTRARMADAAERLETVAAIARQAAAILRESQP